MSLRYSGEHLAWIQRIGKEDKAASRQHIQQKPRIASEIPISISHSTNTSSRRSTVSKLTRQRLRVPLIYEELRGKYCRGRADSVRPPTVAGLSNSSEEVTFAKRNSSRPLKNEGKPRFRGHMVQYSSRPITSNRSADRSSVLSIDREKSRSEEHHNRRSKSNEYSSDLYLNLNSNLNKITEEEQNFNDQENTQSDENLNENENEEECNTNDEMNMSQISNNTKASQLRYIEELERLLRYERSKRIKLEGLLNKHKY